PDLDPGDRRAGAGAPAGADATVRPADPLPAADADDPARADGDPEEVQGQEGRHLPAEDAGGEFRPLQEARDEPVLLVPADPGADAVLLRAVPHPELGALDRRRQHRRARLLHPGAGPG